MAILNTRELKYRGAAAAAHFRPEGRRLVLVYCAVLALVGLGSNGLNLYLNSQISQTGGLGGLGMRSMLQTIQSVLNYVNMFFGPFWSAGFLLAMLGMVRGSAPRAEDLTGGFRRFGRIFSGMIFQLMVTVLVVVGAANVASILFSMTPTGMRFAQLMQQLASDPGFITGNINLEQLPLEGLQEGLFWLLGLTMVLFLPVYIRISYSFRMATYLMVERPIGGFQAHFQSMRLMRGHKWQLFKMDLSYWWYYVLGVVISVVGYLDVILGLAGVAVPVNEMVMFFGTLVVYFVLLTGLYLWKKCDVDAAYVLAFEEIAYPEEETE